MAWVDKSEHILFRRRYQCDVCESVFEDRAATLDAPIPGCPQCTAAALASRGPGVIAGGAVTWVAPRPAIGTTKGKAIDLAQQIAEEDYGLTDINDNQRAGDIAFKPPPPMHTAEREAALREMMQAGVPADLPQEHADKAANYWQGNAGGSAEQTIATQEVSKAAAAAARKQGVDPVGILEQGRLSGNMPMRMNVMGAVPAADLPEPLQKAQAARGT